MKAIVYHKYGSPDVLKMEDIQKPIPSDDGVLVKIHAVSINSWDWDTLTGKPFEYRFLFGLLKPKSTKMHGCDIAGKVEGIGKSVKRFQVGDEVFGDLAEEGWGAFAEYICVSENELVIKLSSMTFEEAACLSHGGNLAVQGLIDYGKIKSGQKVLINGGGGSTGTLAIQIAKLFQVEVTAVDHTVKLDTMLTIGADHVIDYTKDDFTKNEQKYDLIFDVKTNRSVFDYQRVLSPNGIYVTVGGKTSRILQVVFFGKLSKKHKMHMVAYKANFEQYLKTLQSRLRKNGVSTKVFKSIPYHQWFMCMWTSRKRKRLQKCAEQYDAVIVLGCESATETVRDAVKSNYCKVIEGMEVTGIMNAELRFHLPGNVSFENCKTVPIS